MTRAWTIRVARDVLRVIGVVALAAFLFIPLHSFNEIFLMFVFLVLGGICIGGAYLLNLELEIPTSPNNPKHDPSRPLGL